VGLGALLGVAAALGLIVTLLGLAVRALRRYTGGMSARAGRLRIEVLGRVGISPRQGLALVRVGTRGVIVSIGEGGVRPVLELTPEECAEIGIEDEPAAETSFQQIFKKSVGDSPTALHRLVERISKGALALVIVLGGLIATLGPVTPLEASTAPATRGADPLYMLRVAQLPQEPGSGMETTDDIVSALLPRLDLQLGGDGEESGLRLRGTVGTVIVIGLLTLLPTLLLLMTSFTRILVVLHFLRQALGTQSAPPAHLLAALALLLTGFVMAPTLSEVNEVALAPWVDGELEEGEMLRAAVVPLREFMLRQTPERDLGTFLELSESPELEGPEDVPLTVLISAFATSELRTAFQIGFAIFLPFIVIDLVVAAVLTSMGMFMLPPAMIALPCKLLLFVLVDGWSLVVQGLVTSFS